MENNGDNNNYEKKGILGQGAFGIVYKVLNKKDNEDYVMKEIFINDNKKEKLDEIEKEAKLLSKINNEYIVKYKESFIKEKFFYIVMEFCENSDLRKFINKKKEENQLIDQNVILFITLNICIGLKEIHKKKIIHRDLKPENLLISKDYTIKIGDFGIAKQLKDSKYAFNTQTGTIQYMAPEIIEKKNNKFDNRIDIWSLGCIIYELCTLEPCFEDEGVYATSNKIINEEPGKIDTNHYNKVIQDLIDKLLIKNYKNRYNIDQVFDLVYKYNKQFYLINNNKNDLDEISINILKNQKKFFNNKNEIIITIKIDNEDINKNIYFLDNIDYTDDEKGIKHYHDNLKELNENNVELYINDNKYKYEKYYKFKKEGTYKIKLILKNNLKDCSNMFSCCENLISIDLSKFDTKNITNMSNMFYGCKYLENIDLSNFNTENVTNMSEMFSICENLENIDLSKFDTKKVTNMSDMFNWCEKLTNINLSTFDTKNVTNMRQMFSWCGNLTKIDLSKFDTKKVTDMSGMFYRCENLENIDLSNFDTKNVTNMSDMFDGCYHLTNVDLSNFDTKKVTEMRDMFRECEKITKIDLSSFDTKNVTDMNGIFSGCENLNKVISKDNNIINMMNNRRI